MASDPLPYPDVRERHVIVTEMQNSRDFRRPYQWTKTKLYVSSVMIITEFVVKILKHSLWKMFNAITNFSRSEFSGKNSRT